MPGRKKKFSRKRRYTRRFKRGGLATKAYVKKQIRKDDETKYYGAGAVGTTIDYNGGSVNLTYSIAQGTDYVNRIGSQITLRGIHLDYNLQIADTTNYMRVIIAQFIQNTGLAVPTITTLLESTTLGTTNAPMAMYNWTYRQNWIVLYDRLHKLTSVSQPVLVVRKRVRIRYAKKKIIYNPGAGPTYTGTNQVYMFVVSDSSAVAHPSISYQYRLLFDDA